MYSFIKTHNNTNTFVKSKVLFCPHNYLQEIRGWHTPITLNNLHIFRHNLVTVIDLSMVNFTLRMISGSEVIIETQYEFEPSVIIFIRRIKQRNTSHLSVLLPIKDRTNKGNIK
jgi:hypothetical protein